MISGFKSGSLPHQKYYRDQINMPTMHVYGMNDQIIPKGNLRLIKDSVFYRSYEIVLKNFYYWILR